MGHPAIKYRPTQENLKLVYSRQGSALKQKRSFFEVIYTKKGALEKVCSNYYPGGFPQPGRTFNSSEYRYGYNTQEKVDEIAGEGNHYTAKFWEYDPRVLHRWNRDPEFRKYPGESPYLINHGNPIWYSDPLGNDGRKRAQRYKKKHGGDLIKNDDGSYTVRRTEGKANGNTIEFDIEEKDFKDNIFERWSKSYTNTGREVEARIDIWMKRDQPIVRAVLGLIPVISVPSAAKVLYENAANALEITDEPATDIWGKDASTAIDVGVAAAAIVIPFRPGKAILGSSTAGEIIDGVNNVMQFANDAGAFDEKKDELRKKKEEEKIYPKKVVEPTPDF